MSYRKLPRLVVTLLYKQRAFYNSRQFKAYEYLGDALNIIQLLNSKNCMEATILNLEDDPLDFQELSVLASEAFMPLSFGGGVRNIDDAAKLISIGFEKIVLKDTIHGLKLATEISQKFGSQAVSICLNFNEKKRGPFSKIFSKKGNKEELLNERLERITQISIGEILMQDIERDGCECGYRTSWLSQLNNLNVPVLIAGGSRGLSDIFEINQIYPNLNFAGSTSYTYQNGGILVNYPASEELKSLEQLI